MPKPEGWSDKDVERRDKIAESLMKKRKLKKQNAYALATWIIKRQRGAHKKDG